MNEIKKNTGKETDLGSLKPCYLYISKSRSILDDKVEKFKKRLKNKIDFEIDYKVFYSGEEFDESQFYNFYNTPSFISEKKIALIKNFEKASLTMIKAINKLLKSTDKDNFSTVIIIVSLKDKIDNEILRTINSTGIVEKLNAPVSDTLKKWLFERAELDGIKFTAGAATRLIENVNFDTGLLKKEYEKLSVYVAFEKEKVIKETTVDKLVNRVYDMKIFDLVDFIGCRDKKNALLTLKALTVQKQGIIGLITLLHRMFKAFLYIKSPGGQDMLRDYIESHIGHMPYMVSRVIASYRKCSINYSPDEIFKVFKILNEYDFLLRIKNSGEVSLVLKMINDITG